MWDGGDIAAGTDDDDHDDNDDDDRGGDGRTADGAGTADGGSGDAAAAAAAVVCGWDGGGGVRNGHGGQSSLKSNARTPMEVDESGMVTQLHGDTYMICGGCVCVWLSQEWPRRSEVTYSQESQRP